MLPVGKRSHLPLETGVLHIKDVASSVLKMFMMNLTLNAKKDHSMERQKLLIIDDIPENLQVLSRVLMDDYDVFTATSGKEALTAAKMHRPALIFLDVMMFGMENYEICTALKDDPGIRDIPVIFVTAKTDAESETRAFDVGPWISSTSRSIQRWYAVESDFTSSWNDGQLP